MKKNIIYFNTRDELLRFDISKIVYFEGDGNYTYVMNINQLKSAICINLGQMEKDLAKQLGHRADRFCRVGKRYIVNLNFVYQIHANMQRLVLSDCQNFAHYLSVSKEALRKLKMLMLTIKQ